MFRQKGTMNLAAAIKELTAIYNIKGNVQLYVEGKSIERIDLDENDAPTIYLTKNV
jgi:hypothetical protein